MCKCFHCKARLETQRDEDGRNVPDPEVDGLTMAIVAALDAPKRDRVEKAEEIAMIVMEAIRAERTHHEAEHHGYRD